MIDLTVVEGDIADAPEKYICHQCNAVSQGAAHLAAYIFAQFPYANIYARRDTNSVPMPGEEPGKIVISGNGDDQRFVINMIAQYYPGNPRYPHSKQDGYQARQQYFQSCLDKISSLGSLESIAFPWQIGCGAAAGDWFSYRHMIKKFAEKTQLPVKIYRLPKA